MQKKGNQQPTRSRFLPFKKSRGAQAVKLYGLTGRKAQTWQRSLLRNIMAVDKDGLWVHQKVGYSVPRRNGKNEVLTMREFWGLENGEAIFHTAHRTTTSHKAWERLVKLLTLAGYVELGRLKKDEIPPEKSFRTTKQYGLESITLIAERNDRIRKLMERRRASGCVGIAGESNRGIQKSNAELSGYAEEDGDEIRAETERKGLSDTADEVRKLIDNLGAKERASVKKRDDSEAKRENREIGNKRSGTSRSKSASTGSRIRNENCGNKAISQDGESRKR